jgi:hypothetical protein
LVPADQIRLRETPARARRIRSAGYRERLESQQ